MEAFSIYLLKSAGLLSLFFLFYFLLLKRDTSFTTNRQFLLGGLFASSILPAVYFTKTVFIEATTTQYFITEGNFQVSEAVPEEPAVSLLQILFLLYLIGAAIMTGRLALQFTSLFKILVSGKRSKLDNIKVIETHQKIAPFSFLNFIVYNPSLHSENELKHIIKHEQVHVVQWHSADVLLANVNLVYQWFNPLAWLYLRHLQQNLEFIADKEAVKEVLCKKEYQKSLVKISVENFNLALTNNFYQSLIKKRIMMLNKSTSGRNTSWKAIFILPALLAFLFLFNVRTVAQIKEDDHSTTEAASNLEISVSISEKTKQEQLDLYSKIFKKHNVELTFKDVNYNDAGLLTSISAEFLDKNNNSTGSISRSDTNGIDGFTFYSDKEKGSGFRSGEATASFTSSNHSLLSKIGENPLIIIEGEEYSTAQLADKTIKILGKVNSLTSAEATKIYGEGAKDGALVIEKGKILDDFEAELKDIDLENAAVKNDYIQIGKGSKPAFISLDNNPAGTAYNMNTRTNIRTVIVTNDSIGGDKPIYYVNGKVVNATVIDTINPESIDSIQVFKGAKATRMYGRPGTNGVVAIRTKNDSLVGKRFKAMTYSTSPTFVKDRSISITSANAVESDTIYGSTASFVRYQYKEPFVISSDSVDINAYQYGTRTTPSKTIYFQRNEDKPLYIVNGRAMNEGFDLSSIDPQEISSINVLKGEEVIKKYGKKGANGVIQIFTESSESSMLMPTFAKINRTTTDEGLKLTKKQLKEQADIDVKFENVKRNKKGHITEIKVSGKTKGSQVSATYKEQDGIPEIYIGVRDNSVSISSNPPRQ